MVKSFKQHLTENHDLFKGLFPHYAHYSHGPGHNGVVHAPTHSNHAPVSVSDAQSAVLMSGYGKGRMQGQKSMGGLHTWTYTKPGGAYSSDHHISLMSKDGKHIHYAEHQGPRPVRD